MKHPFYLCICILLCAIYTSCGDDWDDGNHARIHVTVRNGNDIVRGDTVFMFESHAPNSNFFTPFYADNYAVTDEYGEVTFDVNFAGEDEMYYFALFDEWENLIEYVSVPVMDGDTKSVEINLGNASQGYYVLKPIVNQTLMTIHGLNYTGDANNRTYLTVKFPRNTEGWYYAVTATSKSNTSPNLRFYDALSRCVDAENGINLDAMSSLYVPAGDTDCNIYLVKDDRSLDVFCDKSGVFEYFTDASRANINSGVVSINEPVDGGTTWYLCFENPAAEDDIYVTVEVCALVWVVD